MQFKQHSSRPTAIPRTTLSQNRCSNYIIFRHIECGNKFRRKLMDRAFSNYTIVHWTPTEEWLLCCVSVIVLVFIWNDCYFTNNNIFANGGKYFLKEGRNNIILVKKWFIDYKSRKITDSRFCPFVLPCWWQSATQQWGNFLNTFRIFVIQSESVANLRYYIYSIPSPAHLVKTLLRPFVAYLLGGRRI